MFRGSESLWPRCCDEGAGTAGRIDVGTFVALMATHDDIVRSVADEPDPATVTPELPSSPACETWRR